MEAVSLLGDEFSDYLQLPNELPARVGELAEKITNSSENVYDKTKAIERYFSRNGFVYDQKDVAVPAEDQDYVDQFLFETKNGYCDNFSTSMVVMLRTIGIPARWVKGFAPGELGRNENKESVY
ncbi:transglutaminase domain-containing protein, partial [Microvirga sp. 3-52]|nr:transglutaminase domain-containing protein [Microvirga sp. 3-52]